MIITFCGHSDFVTSREQEERLLTFLQKEVGNLPADFYLGGYGGFDRFAYDCCKVYQKTHPNVSLVLVTPYYDTSYQKTHLQEAATRYDTILYPEIEDKPKRFAIVYRNRYMIEKADFVVAYITRKWGGAYITYQYAQKKAKAILNLADLKE